MLPNFQFHVEKGFYQYRFLKETKICYITFKNHVKDFLYLKILFFSHIYKFNDKTSTPPATLVKRPIPNKKWRTATCRKRPAPAAAAELPKTARLVLCKLEDWYVNFKAYNLKYIKMVFYCKISIFGAAICLHTVAWFLPLELF